MTLDSLFFQVAEERFRNCVVPTVPPATHAGHQVVVFAPAVELITAKLAALVGMNHHRGFGTPAPHCHHQCR